MNEILTSASDYRRDAHRREIAHEQSAEWHRKWGVRLGMASTTLSAIVGSAIFVIATTRLGLNEKGALTLSIPAGFWARMLFYSVVGLSLLAPVLSGLQTYLKEPEQAAKHTSSSADYSRVKQRLDAFIGRYEVASLAGKEREDALKELDGISEAMERVRKDSIPLTPRAYKDADARIDIEKRVS